MTLQPINAPVGKNLLFYIDLATSTTSITPTVINTQSTTSSSVKTEKASTSSSKSHLFYIQLQENCILYEYLFDDKSKIYSFNSLSCFCLYFN